MVYFFGAPRPPRSPRRKPGLNITSPNAYIPTAQRQTAHGENVSNIQDTLIYEKDTTGNLNSASWLWKRYLERYSPDDIGFFFYNDPERDPNTYNPKASDISDTGYDLITYPTKLSDNKKHTVVGIKYNNTRLKIKKAGVNPANGVPWFYVVSYEQSPSGGPGMLKQYYGEFGDANGSGNSPEYSNISSAVPVGTSFGKKVKRVNSEYTYLKNLR